MDSRSREQDGTRKAKSKPGSDALRWVIANPVGAFVAVTAGSLALAALLYQGSLFWPLSGKDASILGVYSNASALVQAIVGTALVGASAFVAILIATSAAKTAESALAESKLNNKLNSPQYKLAFDAYVDYLHLQSLTQSFEAAKFRFSGSHADAVVPLLGKIKEVLSRPGLVVLVARCELAFMPKDRLDLNAEVAKLLALDVGDSDEPDKELARCSEVIANIHGILGRVVNAVRQWENPRPAAADDLMLVYLRQMLPSAVQKPAGSGGVPAAAMEVAPQQSGITKLLAESKADLEPRLLAMIEQYLAADSNVAGALVLQGSCTFEKGDLSRILCEVAGNAGWDLRDTGAHLEDFCESETPPREISGELVFLLPVEDGSFDSKQERDAVARMMRSGSNARGIVVVADRGLLAGAGWPSYPYLSLNAWLESTIEPDDDVRECLYALAVRNALSGSLGAGDEPASPDPLLAMRERFVRERPPVGESSDIRQRKFDMDAYEREWQQWKNDALKNAPKLLWIALIRESDSQNAVADRFDINLAKEALDKQRVREGHPDVADKCAGMVIEVDIPELRNSVSDKWTVAPSSRDVGG